MKATPLFASLAAVAALGAAGVAAAQPSQSEPRITVTVGGELADKVDELGRRDVDQQLQRLAMNVERDLARSGALAGAQVNLVLTDLKPNRPTMQQTIDRPGLSMFDSHSIGGATIEGEVVTADGVRRPVRYERYSNSLADVFGYTTWEDAERAFDRVGDNLSAGRWVSR
jgi:hypothetical protein